MSPIEAIIAEALETAGLEFETNKLGLDFYLPDIDLYIECKQFYAPRIAEQMARADNIIVVQGRRAAQLLADSITCAFNSLERSG